MWDLLHTHTHHTINQIGASQSLSLKSLTSSLWPTLWGSVSEPTRGYRTGSDTICNDPTSLLCVLRENKTVKGMGPKADNIYAIGAGSLKMVSEP